MPIRQKIMAIAIAVSIFLIIIELVRRRKLKEEDSWLWLLVGVFMIILTQSYDLLLKITNLTGSILPTSTLFFFSIIFLVLLNLSFAVRICKLSGQVKNLIQELAILKSDARKEKE